MCGIGGIVDPTTGRYGVEAVLSGLQRDLHHRGPDDTGMFVSEHAFAGAINTRLAILDLSAAGHQPMRSEDGRYHIVFNGEIYNYAALRAELLTEGYPFRSHSDTEVVLNLFVRSGADSVRELAGMFTIAIWDEQEKAMFLARDPLGIKPLYYSARDRQLVFASEIRALLNTDLVRRELCRDAVADYLAWGAVQDPLTLVEGVLALPAGHYFQWKHGTGSLTKYWEVRFGLPNSEPPKTERLKSATDTRNDEAPKRGRGKSEAAEGYADTVKIVRGALEASIERHFVSDVSVGIFLSGGIDSTAVLALAAQRSQQLLRTFSISFDDSALNEGDVAARTAEHFGAHHTDWRMDAATAKSLLARFLESSDQPSIDGFNTFCVSKLAHDNGLTVVLSGLGGDELFGGYGSFRKVPQMLRASRWLAPVRPVLRVFASALQNNQIPTRYRRLSSFLQDAPTTVNAYWAMRGIFTPAEVSALLPRYGCAVRAAPTTDTSAPPQPTLEDEVSYLELTRYMRNQLLRDSDVMSMAWGLELRVPFADSVLLDTIRSIPASLRLAHGKQILLDAVPEVPEWVRQRPKQGFTFPFKDWVTGEWSEVFQRIAAETPVQLDNWYRCWCLFALDNFVQKNGMRSGK